MKLRNRVLNCALAGVLAVAGMSAVRGQAAPPDLMRVSTYKLNGGGTYDFREGMKMVNDAYKKAGTPWRQGWTVSLFGEPFTVVMVSPVKNFAQFDSPSPIAAMSAQDAMRYQTLMRNSVIHSKHTLMRQAPELSLSSGTMQDPKFARVMHVRVKPGKTLEFEDLIKTMVLPALKQAGIKDYWVNRMVLGGTTGEYTILMPFAKWAEMDSWPTNEKLMGSGYKAFLAKVAEIADGSETMVAATVPELTYR